MGDRVSFSIDCTVTGFALYAPLSGASGECHTLVVPLGGGGGLLRECHTKQRYLCTKHGEYSARFVQPNQPGIEGFGNCHKQDLS